MRGRGALIHERRESWGGVVADTVQNTGLRRVSTKGGGSNPQIYAGADGGEVAVGGVKNRTGDIETSGEKIRDGEKGPCCCQGGGGGLLPGEKKFPKSIRPSIQGGGPTRPRGEDGETQKTGRWADV